MSHTKHRSAPSGLRSRRKRQGLSPTVACWIILIAAGGPTPVEGQQSRSGPSGTSQGVSATTPDLALLPKVVYEPVYRVRFPDRAPEVFTFRGPRRVPAGKRYLLAIQTSQYCRLLTEIALARGEERIQLLLVERLQPAVVPPPPKIVFQRSFVPAVPALPRESRPACPGPGRSPKAMQRGGEQGPIVYSTTPWGSTTLVDGTSVFTLQTPDRTRTEHFLTFPNGASVYVRQARDGTVTVDNFAREHARNGKEIPGSRTSGPGNR